LGAFGEKLRKQREQRGIALDAISNSTKISPRMLRALEEEHFDQLPGGVFNKGFVRAYARQVGLDEEEAVTEYLVALRESQIQQQSILPDFRAPSGKPAPQMHTHEPVNNEVPAVDNNDHSPGPPKEDRRTKKEDRRRNSTDLSSPEPNSDLRPKALPDKYPAGNPAEPSPPQTSWTALGAALLVLLLLLAFWNFRRHRNATTASSAVAASNQSPAPQPAPPPSASSPPPTGQTTHTAETRSTRTAAAPAPATNPVAQSTAETTSPKPAPQITASAAPILPPASKTVASNTAPTNPIAAPAPASPPRAKTTPALKPPPTFTLLIRAEKTTWISIVADGKPVAEETLIAPAHTSVRANHEVYVRAGNAAGISFALNGKEFPAQGNDGEVKTYIFDATGLHTQPASPTR